VNQKKSEKTQIIKIRNERGYITTDPRSSKRIIKEYYEHFMPISSAMHKKNNTIMTKWHLS